MDFRVPDFTFSVEEAARKELEKRNAVAYEDTVGAAVKEAEHRPISEQITLKEYVRNAFVSQAKALSAPEYESRKQAAGDAHYDQKKEFYHAKFAYEDTAGRRRPQEEIASACAKMTEAQLKYAPESVSPERKKAHERYQAAENDQQRLAAGQAMHRAVSAEQKQSWEFGQAVSRFQRQESQMAGMQDKALGLANRVISDESRSRPGQKGEDPQIHQASKSALDSWTEKLRADRGVEKAYKDAGIKSRHDIERAPIERQVDLMRATNERFEKTQQFVDKAKSVQLEKERAQTEPGLVSQEVEPAAKNAAIRDRAFKPEGSRTWHEKGTRLPLMRETQNGVQLIGEAGKKRENVAMALDTLQERGAKTVNLKGSPEFRKEAWLQANERGMAAKGYQPTPEDKRELKNRMAQHQTQGQSQSAEKAPVSAERQEMIDAARAARNQNAEARQMLEARQQQQLVAGQQR